MALQPGDRVGVFEVLQPLGAGGMGEVYRALDTRLKREVALKVLPDRHLFDAHRLARFEREARALAALNHPGIATLYGIEEAGGVQALVMELVEGDTLADRIAVAARTRGAGLPPAVAMDIARQVAIALEAAHECGVVHRDLKPANIKVRANGSVKVLDFGLATSVERQPAGDPGASTITIADGLGVVGTPAYMSPEQARGDRVDRRADVWAFGCVLYEMLTGRRAFEGRTTADVLAHVIDREPDFGALPADTPAATRRLLSRALTKDVRDRLHDMADARLDLAESGAGAPGASPRGLPLVAVVVLMAVAVAAWVAIRGPS
jgi:serine/threonine protein kinase